MSPLTFVNAIGDNAVIAGVGTVGIEILGQAAEVRTILVPVGGGDLAAGVAVAAKSNHPKLKVYGVQAEGAAPLPTALQTGRGCTLKDPPKTIADSISAPLIMDNMAKFLFHLLDGCLLVSDEEIRAATRHLAVESKLVAEPAGAAAFAAWTRYKSQLEGPTVAIVSGGNVPPRLLADIIHESP